MSAQLKLAGKPDTAEVHSARPNGPASDAVRAAPLALNKELSVEQSFRRIAASCCEHIEANHAAVARGNAPEALHQMRVGLRRLRSALDLFGHLLELPEPLRRDLDWLGKELGAARDWDVLASSTLPRVAEDLPDDMELVLVRLAAETRANDLRAAAADAVSSARYADMMRNLASWLHDAEWRGHCTARQRRLLGKGAAGFADRVLEASRARLLKRGGKLKGAGARTRHRVRTAAKKTRYAAEFFQSLYAKKRVRPFVKALSRLQDELGWLNDTAVADNLLKKLQHGEARLDGSAAFTRGYLASTRQGSGRTLRRLWRAFEASKTPA
ncbi:CHAD domain-containing protein [Pseudoduganella sp. LjRoot289]|uniref:CHAD domain-containing protein n=1 Tax=Pseudoduganella sp. LjRoot289 TaxID=3342314 RepID=UPI003ECFDD92